jgi:amylosucrase
MNKDHKKALQLVLPGVKALAKKSTSGQSTHFIDRFTQLFPRLFDGLQELYGHRWDLFYQLDQLCILLTKSWVDRDSSLIKLDEQRIADPLWFRRETMVGAMVYVDLFSETLKGVEKQLPYFDQLGITYLHLMPLFKAPEKESDGGYAVSDYRQVMTHLGTMEDLVRLGTKLRDKGISLVLDFVFNHTSNEHHWAMRAKDGDESYRDYYWVFDQKADADRYNQTLRDIFPDVRPGSFTYDQQLDGWVWTTFNSFQWDLNYTNPEVFRAMTGEMLFLANKGAEVLRLDALAFCWKELGTSCENLPKAHTLIQLFKTAASIAAPALAFKSEAIVHPDEVVKYIKPHECEISYNPLLMALLWEALATRNTSLLTTSLQNRFTIDPACAWVNYIRCHDDIGWTFADEDARDLGIDGYHHRRFLNDFYIGEFPGSFARGVPFQFNPQTGDCRISGTAASLVGLEKAEHLLDPHLAEQERTMALKRLLLLHGIILSIGGIPVLYVGDEIGMLNDYSYAQEPGKSKDSRWVHRPRHPWERFKQATNLSSKDQVPGLLYRGLQHLIQLRKTLPTFGVADTQILNLDNPGLFGFVRTGERRRLMVVANMTDRVQPLSTNLLRLQGLYPECLELITNQPLDETKDILQLGPYDQWWLVPKEF